MDLRDYFFSSKNKQDIADAVYKMFSESHKIKLTDKFKLVIEAEMRQSFQSAPKSKGNMRAELQDINSLVIRNCLQQAQSIYAPDLAGLAAKLREDRGYTAKKDAVPGKVESDGDSRLSIGRTPEGFPELGVETDLNQSQSLSQSQSQSLSQSQSQSLSQSLSLSLSEVIPGFNPVRSQTSEESAEAPFYDEEEVAGSTNSEPERYARSRKDGRDDAVAGDGGERTRPEPRLKVPQIFTLDLRRDLKYASNGSYVIRLPSEFLSAGEDFCLELVQAVNYPTIQREPYVVAEINGEDYRLNVRDRLSLDPVDVRLRLEGQSLRFALRSYDRQRISLQEIPIKKLLRQRHNKLIQVFTEGEHGLFDGESVIVTQRNKNQVTCVLQAASVPTKDSLLFEGEFERPTLERVPNVNLLFRRT
ncbi:MAG: hypothetical protein ACYCOU_05310 [Sulfobacillus sp.]